MGASLIKFAGPGSLKDVDVTQGLITAYAAAFGNRDADGDVIHKGAFAKTINERGPNGTGQIKMLFMHRFSEIIGKVLHIEEDDHGLLFRAKLLLGVQRARDALALYSADMFEHSIGIDVVLPENFRGGDIFEAKLFDVSPVTWGANPETPTVSVKSLAAQPDYLTGQIRKIRHALTKNLKARTLDLSDETLEELEKDASDLEVGLALLEAHVGSLVKSIIPPEDDNEAVLERVLEHLKASSSAPLGTKAAEGTLAADGPQTEDEWLRAVLTNLQKANA